MEIQCHIDHAAFEYKAYPHLNAFPLSIKRCNEFCAAASTIDYTRVFVIEEMRFRKLQHGNTLKPLVKKLFDIKLHKKVTPFEVLIDLSTNKIQLLQ